jgi:hypothetical protein
MNTEIKLNRAVGIAFILSMPLAGSALAAPDPVNLVYRDEFFVDPMVFDPATGMLKQHFTGKLYLPTVVGDNQFVSIGPRGDNDHKNAGGSDDAQVTVDGTWYIDPAQAAIKFDPANPPPHTVLQMRPDKALSRVRLVFKDGSVLEMHPDSQPVLSANFTLGNNITANRSTNYDFFFTETCVLLKETAGKGRHAGMVGTYTWQQGVAIVGPNLQVHSRGIALVTLKKP